MKKYNCSVILCGPAIGKTYLAMHDDRFVDIDGERAKYKYNIQEQSYDDFEKGKSNRGKVVNNDSLEYAINLLNETIKNNKIALISYQKEILEYVINNNIDYCLVYADISLREEYAKRMLDRGNPKQFVDSMTNEEVWEQFFNIDDNDDKAKYKLKLQKGQYLSDVKDLF